MAKSRSVNKTGFVAPIVPVQISNRRAQPLVEYASTQVRNAVGPQLNGRIRNAAKFIETVAPGTLDRVQDAVLSKGAQVVNDGLKRISGGKPPIVVGPGGNIYPNSSSSGSTIDVPVFKGSSNNNFSYALSGAPAPKPVALNSTVKPDTYVSDYMAPVTDYCSPLHLTGMTLQIPTAVGNPLTNYFINNVCFNIQAKAQQVCTFLLDINSTDGFTAANITAAINDGIYALQVYFYYSAILSYDSESKNKNSGMDALRALVDPITLSDYYQLGKRLEDTPIPPRIVQWIRYMSSNFKSGNNAGSPLIRTFFHPQAITGTRPTTSYCSLALTNLSRNNNLKVWTLMRKAFPKWRIGKLDDIPVVPLYDKQFLTIFANICNSQRSNGSTAVNSNTVTSFETAVPYNSFTNHLDGLAFAMGHVYNSSATTLVPGICFPTGASATYPDNRYSFYNVASTQGFYPVHAYPFLGLSRQETATQLLTVTHYPHLYATDKCQNVTGSALCNTAQEVIDFMFETRTTLRLGVQKTFSN